MKNSKSIKEYIIEKWTINIYIQICKKTTYNFYHQTLTKTNYISDWR